MNQKQKQHLEEAFQAGIRRDGRALEEFREISIETGVSSTSHGSAILKAGDCEVIAAVKVTPGTPYPDTPDRGALMVNAELLAMSHRKHEGGRPGMESIEPARVIDRTIRESETIDLGKLCIEEGEKVWMVSIDIHALAYDGNILDLGALAAVAALKDTKMPSIDKDGNVDLENLTDESLPLNHTPVAVTAFKYGDKILLDPTETEEKFYDARLTVGTLEDETPCAMQKGGATPLSVDEIEHIIALSQKKGAELRKLL